MTTEFCDYCYTELPHRFKLRATGFDHSLGFASPSVRTWCGNCQPDDEIDPEAEVAMRLAFWRQTGAQL